MRRDATVGVFPRGKQAGRPTINQARGRHPRICDRFDLTLECIRRSYAHEDSPLSSYLTRVREFFDLFDSFEGYVRFAFVDSRGQRMLHATRRT